MLIEFLLHIVQIILVLFILLLFITFIIEVYKKIHKSIFKASEKKYKKNKTKFSLRYGDIAKGHDNFFFYIKKYENIHYFKKVKKESAKKYNIEEWCDKFEEGITKIKEYQSKLEFHSDLHTSTEPQNLHWIWNQEIEEEFLKECERFQHVKIFDEEMSKNFNQETNI